LLNADIEPNPKDKPKSELQGLNQLVIDAIVNISHIVESLHHRINHVAGVTGHPTVEQTSGLTGLIYKSVRNLSDMIGNSIDVPLKLVNQTVINAPLSPSTKAMQSALNGVLGDYLLERKNPLAIDMHFSTHEGALDADSLRQYLEQVSKQKHPKLLIMVHGLCMNDLQWTYNGHNHGEQLAAQLGYSTLYLNYNSGLHISQNGQLFNYLLESINLFVSPDLQISIVAHSMGGLVSRSAYHYAQVQGAQWTKLLKKMIFLGTPYHGAPLEKTGNWLDMLLSKHPYSAPFGKLIQVRSSGITDLRYGNILDQDWQQRNRFDFSKDRRIPTPLPLDVECYAIAGSLQSNDKGFIDKLLGDGLVTVDSALGWHESKPSTLKFDSQHQCHIKGVNHLQLLSDLAVYGKLFEWLKDD
jgi:pimeloyl-ACP methyl ester carboxylesterase